MRHLPNWFCYAVIALVTLLVWRRTIGYGFVWDDEMFITKNPAVDSLKNIPAMFFSKQAQSSLPDKSEVFRPLRTAQYAVLRVLGGKPTPQPWIYHLANICWHGAAAMLLFAVLRRLFATQGNESVVARGIALLMALGFAVHPVTSEVVCWAKSLDDIMAAVFVLAATKELLVKNLERRNFIMALVWFVLAIYSKESAVPFALFVIFIFRGIHGFSWTKAGRFTAVFLGITFVYLIHRRLVLGQTTQCPPISGSYGQTLIDMFPVATKYVRLVLGIPPFHIDYSYLAGHDHFFSVKVLLGLFIVLGFIGLAVGLWLYSPLKVVALGLIWTGIFLLPVSNLVPMMQYMAERFLYLPIIGLFIALGFVLLKYVRFSLAVTIASALIILWITVTGKREKVWQDELTLFVSSCQEGPITPRTEKDAIVAIMQLPHMSALFPEYAETEKLNMAETLPPEKVQPVIDTLLETHRLFPTNAMVASVLGTAYARIGEADKARQFFELATQENPTNSLCWFDLAVVLNATGDKSKARTVCETSLHLNPKNESVLQLEIKLCSDSKDFKTALDYAEKLLAMAPTNSDYVKQVEKIQEETEHTR